MTDEVRMKRLSVALKVISVAFCVFVIILVLVLVDSSLIAEGTILGRLLLWQPYHKAYESMIIALYIVWGVMLWVASKNPAQNKVFIDFTILANLAHAIVMFIAALAMEGELLHMVGDVLLLLIVSGVLLWLRPRRKVST